MSGDLFQMLTTKIVLVTLAIAVLSINRGDAWGFRVRDVVRTIFYPPPIVYSNQKSDPHCQDVKKAIIGREDWKASPARHEQAIKGIADTVIIRHTGPDTCHVIGLSGVNCQLCLLDESCVKQLVAAMQEDDMDQGMDDIRYNFLVGQDGVIYEGRGWGVVGQHSPGQNDKSLGIALIGDFTKSEPSEALQDALDDLIQCGETSGVLSKDSDLVMSPSMSGKAFYDMIQRKQ